MNSAYVRLAKEQAKRERRTDFIAIALGWSFIVTGALIGAAMFYLFTFTVLSLGA
jgi:heme oxygenase